MEVDLCVGTAGLSAWFSPDRGESWTRPYSESGLYLEARVWALSSHPARPGQILAGTDLGVFRWDPARQHWDHDDSPLDTEQTWALSQDPRDPDVVLAGTLPAAMWRSEDGARRWSRTPGRFAEHCIFVHRPRVTQIVRDPRDPDRLFAGVEIDGVWRSEDAGRSWRKCRGEGLVSEDIHGLLLLPGLGGAETLFAATNKGLHASTDGGETFAFRRLDSPWQYTRQIALRPDGERLFLTNGNGPPGSTGRLLLSDDGGARWRDAGLPGTLNSTPWCLAMHPADPRLIFVCTNLGQIFRSEDGGDRWVKLEREFGEVRCILWQPR
jgi:photosystem II stability/assembly factor-like uncharacterized protein